MDCGGSPLFSPAQPVESPFSGAQPNGRGGSVKLRADGGGERQDETALLDGCMKGNPARHAFTGAQRIIHHVRWQHLQEQL